MQPSRKQFQMALTAGGGKSTRLNAPDGCDLPATRPQRAHAKLKGLTVEGRSANLKPWAGGTQKALNKLQGCNEVLQ